VSIGIAAEYAHPVEEFFANFLPTFAGPALSGSPHAVVLWSYLSIRLWETIDAHSGYSFPWSPWKMIPFIQGGPDKHDFHHSHNVGNFGMLAFWDWVCGTDKPYKEWKAKQDAKKKLSAD